MGPSYISFVQKVDVFGHTKDVIRRSRHGEPGFLGHMLPNTEVDKSTETMTKSNGFFLFFPNKRDKLENMSPKTNSRPNEITLPYSSHSQTTSGSPIQCIASRFWPEWNEDNDNRT